MWKRRALITRTRLPVSADECVGVWICVWVVVVVEGGLVCAARMLACRLYVLKASSRGQKTQGYSTKGSVFYLTVLWKHTEHHFSSQTHTYELQLPSHLLVLWIKLCFNAIRLIVQRQKCAEFVRKTHLRCLYSFSFFLFFSSFP